MDNKGIYFTELNLKNVRCFGDEATLKLSNDKGEWSRWNVILGDNSTGKTTLLQCLAGMEQKKSAYEIEWYSIFYHSFKENKYSFLRTKKYLDVSIKANLVNQNNKVNGRIGFTQSHDSKAVNGTVVIEDSDFASVFILGYGANRRISFQILSEKELTSEISATLFDDDAKLINAEEWLYQMDYAASRDSNIQGLAIKRRDLIIESLKSILPDVEEIKFKAPVSIDKPVPRLEFKTPYGWVGIKELSYGYKTMVAWIVDVAAQMFKRYPNSDNPLEEPVIILVDEIDLHLHPKWQRQIFDFLETRFPRAQFIVTAHSPLIVQSAPKDANIIVLRKEQVDGENVVVIDNDVKSVWNWRIDQIMSSDLFGIDGLRNPEIDAQMDERTILLQKKNLTESEKARLEVLNDISQSLPTAEDPLDIEAMQLIRDAAMFLKNKQKGNDTDQN